MHLAHHTCNTMSVVRKNYRLQGIQLSAFAPDGAQADESKQYAGQARFGASASQVPAGVCSVATP